jgi:hypothetical protein
MEEKTDPPVASDEALSADSEADKVLKSFGKTLLDALIQTDVVKQNFPSLESFRKVISEDDDKESKKLKLTPGLMESCFIDIGKLAPSTKPFFDEVEKKLEVENEKKKKYQTLLAFIDTPIEEKLRFVDDTEIPTDFTLWDKTTIANCAKIGLETKLTEYRKWLETKI